MAKKSKMSVVPPAAETTPPGAIEPEPASKKYSTGSTIKIGSEDAGTIRAALEPLMRGQQNLGALREDFAGKEQQVLQALGKARESYNSTVIAIGRKRGINLGPGSNETWSFNAEEMSFTRNG